MCSIRSISLFTASDGTQVRSSSLNGFLILATRAGLVLYDLHLLEQTGSKLFVLLCKLADTILWYPVVPALL